MARRIENQRTSVLRPVWRLNVISCVVNSSPIPGSNWQSVQGAMENWFCFGFCRNLLQFNLRKGRLFDRGIIMRANSNSNIDGVLQSHAYEWPGYAKHFRLGCT